MRALSIIGIILSLIGMMLCLFVMTEAKAPCFCNDEYSGGSVPDEAVGGSLLMLVLFIFFMVYSIVALVKSFGNNNPSIPQTIPPYQAMQYPNYQQQQFQNQNSYPQNQQQFPNQQNQNPYSQNPPDSYRDQPTNIPPENNPWAPKK